MMRQYGKFLDETGIYITAIAIGSGIEISESEYKNILSAIHQKPVRTDTVDYRLRNFDLSWEAYPVEPIPPEPEEASAQDYEASLERLGVEI